MWRIAEHDRRCWSRRGSLVVGVIALMVIICSLPTPTANAQAPPAPPKRIFEGAPYDVITVVEADGEQSLEVLPLSLPERKFPPSGTPPKKLRVRLNDETSDQEFELQWKDIKSIQFFEDLILKEADQLALAQDFDAAYPYFQYMLREYPKHPRLPQSMQTYWYLHAGVAFRGKRYEEALGLAEEVVRANPNYRFSDKAPAIMKVLGDIADKLIQRHVEAKDFSSARKLLTRLTEQYPSSEQEPFANKWRQTLTGMASAKRDESLAFLQQEKFTEAYDAAKRMMEIWPRVSGGQELQRQIAVAYPLVVVGVMEPATAPNALQLEHWANRRAGRLTQRYLVEPQLIGSEGGAYRSPLGQLERSEDNRTLRITLHGKYPRPVTGFDVSTLLLAGARPDSPWFKPAWAEICGVVRMVRPDVVEVGLRRPHVVPLALLDFPLSGLASDTDDGSATVAYKSAPGESSTRFLWPAGTPVYQPTQPREILERQFTDPEAAVLALEQGQIDCLDRILPVDLEKVRAMPGVKVQRFGIPTVHVLIPNFKRPWPALRTLRRAVQYAIQREAILKQGILRGKELAGAQVVSAPFPAPVDANDPLSYAYDKSVSPYAYEPLLATTLAQIARREAEEAAKTKQEKPPQLNELVIGHPVGEIPRMACRAMAQQLKPIGLNCKVVEVAQQNAAEVMPDVDFLYAELSIFEPATDAMRLFGPRGRYPAASPHLRLAVNRVAVAANWNEAGQRLRQLHRLIHEELPLLPLYQLPEHFAVRNSLQGIVGEPITLYQDVENWKLAGPSGTE